MATDNQLGQQVMDYKTAGMITDSLFTSMDKGYKPVGDYLTNVAGQETLYGTLPSHMTDEGIPISATAFQIDPIKYQDFLTASGGGEGAKRLETINAALRDRGYGEDFDLRNVASIEQSPEGSYSYTDVDRNLARDPLVGTMLARTLLASDPNPVPSELYNINPATGQREPGSYDALTEEYGENIPHEMLGQSGYWKQAWNTASGAGKAGQFEEKFETYRQSVTKEDDIMDSMKTMDEIDFSIGTKK